MKDRITELFEKIWARQPHIRALRQELEAELEKDRAVFMQIEQECKGEAL